METNESKIYELAISGHGIEIKKEISEELAHRILILLVPSQASKPTEVLSDDIPDLTEGTSPKIFMIQKKPRTDLEKITCLAYYLNHYRATPQFKTKDLSDLNREAQQIGFSNASVTSRNAVRDGYLSLAGGGRKQITTRGEFVVEALPDRDRVKKALEESRGRHRKTKRSGKSKSARTES